MKVIAILLAAFALASCGQHAPATWDPSLNPLNEPAGQAWKYPEAEGRFGPHGPHPLVF